MGKGDMRKGEHAAHWGSQTLRPLWGPWTEKGCSESQKRGSCVLTQAPSPESKQGVGLESGTCPFGSSSGAKLWDPWTPCGSLQRYLTLILPFSIDAKQTPCSPPFILWDRGPLLCHTKQQGDRLLSSWVREQRLWRWPAPQSLPNPSVPKAEAGAAASSH